MPIRPLPFSVRASTIVGRSLTRVAVSKAAIRSGMLCPSTIKRLPTECFPASLVDFKFPLQHRRLTLTQPIDVNDRAEIVETAESRPLCGLPDRAFSRFAITHQNKNALAGMVELFRVEGDPSGQQTSPALANR